MASLKEFSRQQRNMIGEVLRRERLLAHAVATVQGPLTLTYRLRLVKATANDVKRFLSLDTALQAALQVEAVRVQQVKGLIEIQVPSPAPTTPTAAQMADASEGLNVAVGWDAFGRPVCVDLRQHGAVFWVGPSRRGKTQSMRSTLYALCRGYGQALRYAIICQRSKLYDWQAFDGAGHSMGIVTCDSGEVEDAVKWFANRTRTGRGRYEYIVMVDDLPSVLQSCKIARELADIASVGAGVGVHLLAGTQAAGSKAGSGGEIIESNITARIVYKPASKATAARNAGVGGLDLDQLSSAKGDAVLLIDGYPERVATSLAHDREILTLPQKRVESMYRVWLKNQVVQGGTAGGANTGTAPVQTGTGGGVLVVEGSDPVVPVQPVQVVQAAEPATLKLPVDRDLTQQEKLHLFAAYQYFGSKNKTCINVFGYKSPKSLALLDDAIAYAGGQQVSDEKIIKLNERRVA